MPATSKKAKDTNGAKDAIRLKSTSLCNTPGILAWAMNGYKFKSDRKAMAAVFTEGFGLTDQCAHDLLSGKIPHSIEGDSVVFEYPSGQWGKESQ